MKRRDEALPAAGLDLRVAVRRRPLRRFAAVFILRHVAALALLLALGAPARAKKLDKAAIDLGPYRLGTSYDELKALPGFKLDPDRTKPAENLVAAKIIDQRVAGTPTIQRFTFKNGRLIRVSIIFHPPERWTEAAVKTWLAAQWGDPGDKELVEDRLCFFWEFTGSRGVIMPADGNRFMASLWETRSP